MSKFRFKEKASKFQKNQAIVLTKIATNSLNYFKVTVFDKRAFDGKKWTPNQKQTGSQQLVKSGRMRSGFFLRKYFGSRVSRIDIINNVPYFEFHNEGTDKLPKRQMMGESKELNRKNRPLLKQLFKFR